MKIAFVVSATAVLLAVGSVEVVEGAESSIRAVEKHEKLSVVGQQNGFVCCDPDDRPTEAECGRTGCTCCDGKWMKGNSGPSTESPSKVCRAHGTQPSPECKCCDPTTEPGHDGNAYCFEGHTCCPNTGEWSCSIGDAKHFTCGRIMLQNPKGKACPSSDHICSLPKEVGTCKAKIPRFYFNSESGECEEFIYGGCQGNGNNFETMKECVQTCAPPEDIDEELLPPEVVILPIAEDDEGDDDDEPCCKKEDIMPCARGTAKCCPEGQWVCPDPYHRSYKCESGATRDPKGSICDADVVVEVVEEVVVEEVVKEKKERRKKCCDRRDFMHCLVGTAKCCPNGSWTCPNGDTDSYSCPDDDGVAVQGQQGQICGDHMCCDPEKKPSDVDCGLSGCSCCSNGVWVPGNSGPSVETDVICKSFNLKPSKPCEEPSVSTSANICILPAEVGPCDAAIPRYFFNSGTSTCEEFTYGGCEGNENNFETVEKCMRFCATRQKPEKEPKSDESTREKPAGTRRDPEDSSN